MATCDGRAPQLPAARRGAPRAAARGELGEGAWRRLAASPGHQGATLSFYTAIGCHSLGVYTVDLLPLLSFSAEMTVSPRAIASPAPCAKPCCT